jgi:uncharacterized RDD family membrane protein YckC
MDYVYIKFHFGAKVFFQNKKIPLKTTCILTDTILMGEALRKSEEVTLELVASTATTPANYLQRTVAFLVDLTVISAIHFTVNFVFVKTFLALTHTDAKEFLGSTNFQNFSACSELVCYITYFTLSVWYTNGSTAGKRLCGIRVQNSGNSEISFSQALLRSVGYLLSYATLSIGFLLPLFRRDHLALHDLCARTRVSVRS